MSSLKTRAMWGMVITMVSLIAGIVLLCSAHGALDNAFNKVVAHSDKAGEDELAITMVGGMLPFMGGASLAILGAILFPLFLAVWIRNPPPGSKLGFRGWKTPDQLTPSDLAQDKAWRAILWGYLASQTWVFPLFTVGFRGLLSHTSITMLLLLVEITICAIFYALGVRLCRRRDPASAMTAPWSWKAAMILNYGGLLGFLLLISAVFLLRSRS